MGRALRRGAAVALAGGVAGCGGGDPPATTPTRASPGPAPVRLDPPFPLPRGLAVGLTEFDPGLIAGPATGSPALLGSARRLAALRPLFFRLPVLWRAAQPHADSPPDWEAPGIGGHSPRAQLRALAAARRRAGGGFEPLVTFYDTPAWAADQGPGCAPPTPGISSRAPGTAALPAYRRLVRSLLELARAEGIPIRFWSAWNEPNSGLFLAPQRVACDPRARSIGPSLYAPLVRALRAELDAAPGDQEVVVGDTSSPYAARARITQTAEFVRGLPPDVACAGRVWAHHQYVGDADRLAALRSALDARRCPGPALRIWITETGVGTRSSLTARPTEPAILRAGCRALHAALGRWHRDPRVDVAIQYTFREDPNFPVGLAGPDLRLRYPAYAVWRAWGGRRGAADPAPALPRACRG